jgi:Transglutaminase-like superfamily
VPLGLSDPPVAGDWIRHTPTSDPGELGSLLDAVAPIPADVGPVACNLIAHYRAHIEELPAETRPDIHLRWLAELLAADQLRHPDPLTVPRPLPERIQGCCRDHTLFSVGVLRQHGVAARSRVGFASYFEPDWNHDHVVAEFWAGDRWCRFDPEIEPGSGMLPDPHDLAVGVGARFQTAAEVFTLMRSGDLDPATYGVSGTELRGEPFVAGEVFYEVAHRYGDEVLLWDTWGALPAIDGPVEPEVLSLLDEVAALLLAADAGNTDAEATLFRRYCADRRLHPGGSVVRWSPLGDPPVEVSLGRQP